MSSVWIEVALEPRPLVVVELGYLAALGWPVRSLPLPTRPPLLANRQARFSMPTTLPSPTLLNRVLAKLPAADLQALLVHLKPVELHQNQVLYDFRGTIDYAYFPTGAVLSALTVMLDGSSIEVATIGNEGLAGHSVALGIMISSNKMIAQIAGNSFRVEARILQDQVANSQVFRNLLNGYHSVFMTQVSQSVACNGLHRVEQRCCRWLLMSRDRVESDNLRLTHEFLAFMLGTRRASISDVLRPLQEAGLIRSHRGEISIQDGSGLESRACECYQVVKDEYDQFFNSSI